MEECRRQDFKRELSISALLVLGLRGLAGRLVSWMLFCSIATRSAIGGLLFMAGAGLPYLRARSFPRSSPSKPHDSRRYTRQASRPLTCSRRAARPCISDLPTDFRVGALNRDASINSSESASIPTSGLNSLWLYGGQVLARANHHFRDGDAACLNKRVAKKLQAFCPLYHLQMRAAYKRAVGQHPSAQRN